MSPAIADRLSELQAEHLPRLTWRDILKPTEGSEEPSAEDQAAMDAYFRAFVAMPHDAEGKPLCIGCGSRVRGGIEGVLLGGAPGSCTMQWSLAHGECHCSVCGWPARAYHYDIGGTGEAALIARMNVTLQIHPDELQIERE
jgi:hypothetical protein